MHPQLARFLSTTRAIRYSTAPEEFRPKKSQETSQEQA
jgi:hypothetical protein